jgi:hypothetical protein
MSMDEAQVSGAKPSGGAQRMRLYRQRRQRGDRSVRILLSAIEIDTLVRNDYLDAEARHDWAAIQQAAQFYLSDALWDARHGV